MTQELIDIADPRSEMMLKVITVLSREGKTFEEIAEDAPKYKTYIALSKQIEDYLNSQKPNE